MMATKKEVEDFCRSHITDLSKLGNHSRIEASRAEEIVESFPEASEAEAISDERVLEWHHVPLI